MEGIETLAKTFRGDDMITISLDGCLESYTVQKALLISASPYFDRALNAGFKESHEKAICLPGYEPATFELFLYWLVHKKVPLCKELKFRDDAEAGEAAQNLVARAWVFADAHLLPTFQDLCMRLFFEIIRYTFLRPSTVSYVMAATDEKSKLRTVVVEEAIADCSRTQSGRKIDMDAMGEIPGFFAAYAKRLSAHDSARSEILRQCPSKSQVGQYLVGEAAVL